jgi:hypothetical protein
MSQPSLVNIFRLVTLALRANQGGSAANPRWHEMAEQADGSFNMPSPEYPAAVTDFMQEASKKCWSDTNYDPSETARMISNERLIADATLQQLRTMVTYVVRGEKFCDGHWAAMFRDGYVMRLADRLRQFLPTFEYCALTYLNMWLNGERRWVDAMRGANRSAKLAAMKSFANAYRISRNFELIHEMKDGVQTERYGDILDIIDPLAKSDFAGEKYMPTLIEICNQISLRYGGSGVLSGTVKFLWLKLQSPIIIYDSQARLALATKDGDISDFQSRWQAEFQRNAAEISEVCLRLWDVRRFCVRPRDVTQQFMEQTASQPWFHERVFDIFLWTVGGGESPPTNM